MELNLKNYPSKSLLASYEYIFSQYLGGQTSSEEELKIVATPYIFGEICTEIRVQYLSRKTSKVEDIIEIEKKCVSRLSTVMSLPEKTLRKLYEQMVIKSEEMLRKIRITENK